MKGKRVYQLQQRKKKTAVEVAVDRGLQPRSAKTGPTGEEKMVIRLRAEV